MMILLGLAKSHLGLAALALAVGLSLGAFKGYGWGREAVERQHTAAVTRLQGRLARVESEARATALRLIEQAEQAEKQSQELEDAAHQADGANSIVLDVDSVRRIYSR